MVAPPATVRGTEAQPRHATPRHTRLCLCVCSASWNASKCVHQRHPACRHRSFPSWNRRLSSNHTCAACLFNDASGGDVVIFHSTQAAPPPPTVSFTLLKGAGQCSAARARKHRPTNQKSQPWLCADCLSFATRVQRRSFLLLRLCTNDDDAAMLRTCWQGVEPVVLCCAVPRTWVAPTGPPVAGHQAALQYPDGFVDAVMAVITGDHCDGRVF